MRSLTQIELIAISLITGLRNTLLLYSTDFYVEAYRNDAKNQPVTWILYLYLSESCEINDIHS